jgi:hypothetical protein
LKERGREKKKEYKEYEEYKEGSGARIQVSSLYSSYSLYSLNSLYSFFLQLFLFYADHRRSHPFLSGRSVSRSSEVGDGTPRTLVD